MKFKIKIIFLISAMLVFLSLAGCQKNNPGDPEKIDFEARYADLMTKAELCLDEYKRRYTNQIEQGIPFEADVLRDECEKVLAAVKVCKPFHIYQADNDFAQYVYYIPFADKDGKIQLFMSAVMQGDGKIGIDVNNVLDDLIPMFNEMEYQSNDVIVYVYEKKRYIESRDKVLPKASPWTLSFDEKKAIINEAEKNLRPLPTPGGHSLNDLVG